MEIQLNSVPITASTMILFKNTFTVQARTFTNRGQLNDMTYNTLSVQLVKYFNILDVNKKYTTIGN